jgi:S-adenosylmethionine:diacylglycerol 3-amino-3-carboxypropyl transferase
MTTGELVQLIAVYFTVAAVLWMWRNAVLYVAALAFARVVVGGAHALAFVIRPAARCYWSVVRWRLRRRIAVLNR